MKLNKKIIRSSRLLSGEESFDVGGEFSACHGHFNVVHPGHHRFLHFVKEHAPTLVVIVLGDQLLLGGDRTFFPQEERANAVASIETVDRVVLVDHTSLEDVLRHIKPEVYAFGKEFEKDRHQEIAGITEMLERIGTRIVFGSGDISYSRHDFLERNNGGVSRERLSQFKHSIERNHVSLLSLRDRIDDFEKLRILVIGDSIVDHFVACDAIGMSAEAPVIAVKEIDTKSYIGGAAIVASHIAALGASCTFVSVVGSDDPADFLNSELQNSGVKPILFVDGERPTTFKIRYMVDNQKLLRVSRLQESNIPLVIEEKICDFLRETVRGMDGVIVSDFVYGLITPRILEVLTETAHREGVRIFGDLQCSSQIGNVTRFKEFDLITPTEREVRIALSDQDSGIEKLAANLQKTTHSKNLMITLGAEGMIAYHTDGNDRITSSDHFPALVSNPVDVAGAGDTLLSAASLALASGFSLMEASVVGSCAAAIAVNRVGNIPLRNAELKKYMKELSAQMGGVR